MTLEYVQTQAFKRPIGAFALQHRLADMLPVSRRVRRCIAPPGAG
jgi:hypothetical protein